MRLLELDPTTDAYGRGLQHGRACASDIHEIAGQPNAMATCAGLLMDLGRRELWARQGCLHDAAPERFTLA